MTVLHLAAANDYVLGRNRDTSPVIVPAGLDLDTVVAGCEVAILDQHIGTGFGIAPVGIWSGLIRSIGLSLHVHATHCDIGAQHWMDLPHRRISERHAFDQNILAAVRLNELRPQVASFAIDTLADGRGVGHLLVEPRAGLAL